MMTRQTRSLILTALVLAVLVSAAVFVQDRTEKAVLPEGGAASSTASTTAVSEATSSASSTPSVTPVSHTPAPSPAPAPKPVSNGPVMITPEDNGKTVHEPLGSRFGVAMGDTLDWSLSFDPQGIVERVKNIATIRGEQGVYTAMKRGTTKLTATGTPRCEPGAACPQFLQHVEVTIVVD